MPPSALILIADGTEEIEFTTTYDTLVRAGVLTTSAFVPGKDTAKSESPPFAKGSRGINILPDSFLDHDCGPGRYDLLVIPGGAVGADTISKNKMVQKFVVEYLAKKKMVGMICAGSLAALTSGLPKQRLTSHPSVKKELEEDFEYSEEPVVVSGKLVTSRGPGTAFPFALTLVELLCGADKRAEVYKPLIFPPGTPF
ncbi:class I glutamine amidotransferase-like protein [Lyophyllum atratum]|nr:class I glutamine amidotransferase-like protein [Lyophyllum atratum]